MAKQGRSHFPQRRSLRATLSDWTDSYMRSSKSRSRNKNRNNRPSGGNIINRVFDSSGPEGKVRGTPQQIIEKYNQLHRDAQLAGDRVNAENYAQHAEHYTRILANAQKEVERQRQEQEQANRDRQAERDRERAARLKAQEDAANGGKEDAPEAAQSEDDQPQQAPQKRARKPRKSDQPKADPGAGDQPDVDLGIGSVGFLQADEGQSDLVDTPEDQADKPERKPRKPRARKPKAEGESTGADNSTNAAE